MARFALSIILFCAMSNAVVAQDAIPDTPPELRDFRLDPPRPTAQPQPEPQPRTETVTPPPVVPTVTERQTVPARPQRQSQRPAVEAPSTAEAPRTTDTNQTGPVSAAPEVVAEPSPEALPPESPPVAVPEAAPATFPFWQIAAGLALLVMALLAGFWFRRKRAAASQEPQIPDIAPPRAEALRTAEPVRPVMAATPAQPGKQAEITLDFIPEKATVSFTTLTLKGQLFLINEGSALAKDMQLRAGLISASARQDEAIEAFHASSAQVKAQPLGDAKAGERIGLAIELSVPLTDMESFAVGNQKLLVPIVVANLSYGNDNGSVVRQQTARIACMIGREATPPAPRMGPLRLDLGPRSFAPLGQRPLNA